MDRATSRVARPREQVGPVSGRFTRLHDLVAGGRLGGGAVRARVRRRPFILSHLVTGRCNACCPTCLWKDTDAGELDAEACAWLYGEAAKAGIAQLVVWGGEPLLREDLPELLAAAKRARLVVVLITNGLLLAERWPELRGRVDALILSVDDVGEAHDRLRGLPGLFARLEASVLTITSEPDRPRLLVNTVLSRLNRGALRRVAPVARQWGAGLYFCPMETGRMRSTGFVPLVDDLALGADELSEAARTARILKRAGYPIMATDRYLDLLERDPSLSGYTCRAPRAILTVEADGTVRDCMRRDDPLARVDRLRDAGRSLEDVFSLPRYAQMIHRAANCTSCNNPDVIEISWLWDLELQILERTGRLLAG